MRSNVRTPLEVLRRFTMCLLVLFVVACGQQNGTGSANGSQEAPTAPAATAVASATELPAPAATSVPTEEASDAPVEAATSVPTETEDPTATSVTTEVAAETATSATTEVAAETTTTAVAAQTTVTPGPGEFQNPVIRSNFPDPGIINVDGTYYAYATNGTGKNIQAAKSTDLIKWTILSDAMPALPKWTQLTSGFVWAPEVMKIGDTYAMYYTARDKARDIQCVGVSTSDKPEGKFIDTRDEPLVCQDTEGGTIDANPFQDGDKLYLYYKNDGNCCAKPTYIYAQEMSADGLSLVGEPTRLIVNDQAWEGGVVEAPTMWKHDDKYYMFYSANDYGGAAYSVGYATCDTPMGPCQDAPENPILKSAFDRIPAVVGPGHQTIIVDDDGEEWVAYHQWEVSKGGLRTDRRFMSLDRLTWEDGKPKINGPTSLPQAVP